MSLNIKNIIEKIKKPFQQGLSGKEVTKAIIISLLFTVFPVFGVTTILITFIGIKFKLNLPIMIIIGYLTSPLQYMLFLPFIRIGETVLNINHTLLTVREIKNAFDISFLNTIKELALELICGVSGWLLIALPISLMAIFFNDKINNLIQNQNATY